MVHLLNSHRLNTTCTAKRMSGKINALHSAFDEDYSYDELNRLTSTDRNSTAYQSWDLDALGNSNSVTTSGVTENRTHNSQNQLTGKGSDTLAFDANGNTITDQNGRTLVYDAWNRLVEAKNGSTSLIRYEYDGLTRRIEEGTTRQYFSAAWQVLEERNASNQVTVSYAWSPVYADAMIARDRNTVGNATVLEERLYALQDANFNVTGVVNASGTIVERYLFDPYGKRVVLDGTFAAITGNISTVNFQHGHQGGKYDSLLTNHMLFRNRVYDSDTMRWLQEDPMGFVDGLLTFAYEQSNPSGNLDPSGLKIKIDCPIDEYLESYSVTGYVVSQADEWRTYSGNNKLADPSKDSLEAEILGTMILAETTFGFNGLDDLKKHVAARSAGVAFTLLLTKVSIPIAAQNNYGKWANTSYRRMIASKAYYDDILNNPSKFAFGCGEIARYAVTSGSVALGGRTDDELVSERKGASKGEWIPGDWGFIANNWWDGKDYLTAGENIVYVGMFAFAGFNSQGVQIKSLGGWRTEVRNMAAGYTQQPDKQDATLDDKRRYTGVGLAFQE